MTDAIPLLLEENKLKCKTVSNTKTGLSYSVVNFCDDKIDASPELGIYNSVVFKGEEPSWESLAAYSPPHFIDYDAFKEKHPHLNPSDFSATEIVEGTMINVFYDDRIGRWELATRSHVGGHNWYFRTQYPGVSDAPQPTFRKMFLDAIGCKDNEDMQRFFCDFATDQNYVFVLQHPDNEFVFEVAIPRVYLVSVYRIFHYTDPEHPTAYPGATLVRPSEYESTLPEIVGRPKTYRLSRDAGFSDRYDEFECVFRNIEDCAGIAFTHLPTGERTELKNETYERLKTLRGNHPNLQYHFFKLHREGNVAEFLAAFPRYSNLFSRFFDQLIQMTYIVYGAYRNYYVMHRKEHIPREYFIHAARIHHDLYLPSLMNHSPVVVTPLVVRRYFECMEPGKIVHCIKEIMKGLHA